MAKDGYYTEEEINYMDAGIWAMGNDLLRHYLALALSKIPMRIVDKLEEKCFFLASERKQRGCYISPNFFKNKALIVISEWLLEEGNEGEIVDTILHEAAHCILEHKNILIDRISQEEYHKQEAEADALVAQWLNKK
jgi:urease gamma subunit